MCETTKGLDHGVEKAERVDDGYVEFEFIGKENRLNEKAFTRGANCTSIDAAMIGVMKDGSKKLFLIEWKYTEEYAKEDKYIEERSSRYDAYITDPSSPFKGDVEPTAYYYEPFYQLMRQTLLAWQCTVHRDYGISDYLHVHIAPSRRRNTSV
jgi:hypothetical protein